MDLLSFIGNVASILGLLVSVYTLYKVENLPATLRQRSRDQQVSHIIDRIMGIPPNRSTITESTAREVDALLKIVRLYYTSRNPFGQRHLKSLLATLQREVDGSKQLKIVQQYLGLIRDEIIIR